MKGLAPAAEDRIVEALRRGLPLNTAASLAGQSPARVRGWISAGTTDPITGQPGDQAWASFASRCYEARAEAEQVALDCVLDSARGWEEETLERRAIKDAAGNLKAVVERKTVRRVRDWRAAAWYLERARAEQYGGQLVEDDASRPVKRVVLSSRPAYLPDGTVSTNGHTNGNGHAKAP